MAFPTALLDANVLYPAGLRDFLLRLADQYLYAPLWSADIHAEWTGNLLEDRPDLTVAVLERTRAVMDIHGGVVISSTSGTWSLKRGSIQSWYRPTVRVKPRLAHSPGMNT